MGLFDLFSNDTAEKAAELANQGLQRGYSQLSDLYGQGRGALESNYGKAADVWTNYGNETRNLIQGTQNPYAQGAGVYGDVSGANGVEGLQRGTDIFRNSGQYGVYGFANDEAQRALQRTHAAAGNLSSGNADSDAMARAAGLAGQHWGQFQTGLQPYLGADQSMRTNLLNASVNTAGTGAQGLANTYGALGAGLNTSFQGQGGAANASATGQGQNLAGAELNNYKVGANQLNALLGVGQLALGMPPTSFSSIGGGSGGGGGGTPIGQTPGQAFDYSKTPIASLFSGFGKG